MNVTQNQEQKQINSLSLHRQEEIRQYWNKVMKDPFAFIPCEEKERGLTLERAEEENKKLGMFATGFLKNAIAYLTTKNSKEQRLKDSAKIVAVGFGKNYDSEWLEEAVEAGLGTWWIDVSDVACNLAEENLWRQWEKIPEGTKKNDQIPIVRRAEIQTVLAEPEDIGLDTESVEIWYFCRLLGCLSDASARAILQEIGQVSLSEEADPEGRRALVIINAFSDCNRGITSKTSVLRSKKSVLQPLTRGARRPIKVVHSITHVYFSKTVSAMTIMADT